MALAENDLDIYYAVGNTNTKRQENEIEAIIKKRNSAGWKLISTSTAKVDISNDPNIPPIYGKTVKMQELLLNYFLPKQLRSNFPRVDMYKQFLH